MSNVHKCCTNNICCYTTLLPLCASPKHHQKYKQTLYDADFSHFYYKPMRQQGTVMSLEDIGMSKPIKTH